MVFQVLEPSRVLTKVFSLEKHSGDVASVSHVNDDCDAMTRQVVMITIRLGIASLYS